MVPELQVLLGTGLPGGATCLGPVARNLARDRRARASCLAGPLAFEIFERMGLGPERCEFDREDLVEDLLRRRCPDVVVTGLLGNRDAGLDYRLKRCARNLGIPSMGILDSWMHLASRLRPASWEAGPWSPPDVTATPDAATLDELASWGVPGQGLLAAGHPFVESLAALAREDHMSKAKAALGLAPETPLWVFFSEPISRVAKGDGNHPGYDEFDMLALALQAARAARPRPFIAIKEHPRQATLQGAPLPSKEQGGLVALDCDPLRLALGADLVLGMTSTLLVWSWLAGRKTCVLQGGGGQRGYDNVLTMRRYVQGAQSAQDILNRLHYGPDTTLEMGRGDLFWGQATAARCAKAALDLALGGGSGAS